MERASAQDRRLDQARRSGRRPSGSAAWGRLRGQLAILTESILIALRALVANKLRTSLTLLGIMIGVGTVVAMASILTGLDRSMAENLASLGSGSIYLTKHEASIQIGGHQRREQRPDLTLEDAEAIEEHCPSVAAASPNAMTSLVVEWEGQQTKRVSIQGTGADMPFVEDRTLASGRFFTRGEMWARARVCVLGADVADVLFGAIDPVGLDVRVGGYRYRVLGVLEEKGQVLGNNLDEVLAVPVTTLQQERGWGQVLDYILIQPTAPDQAAQAREEVESLLRRRRGLEAGEENNFGLTTQENLLELYTNLTRAIYAVMLLVSGIALMVGGIGIMNMMLVSVRERTREIGIRRALGGRRRDILVQFLAEAITLTMVGGAVGILGGGLLGLIVSWVSPLPAALPVGVVLFALALSTLIGLFFGLYPAWHASKQDPIEALRYE